MRAAARALRNGDVEVAESRLADEVGSEDSEADEEMAADAADEEMEEEEEEEEAEADEEVAPA